MNAKRKIERWHGEAEILNELHAGSENEMRKVIRKEEIIVLLITKNKIKRESDSTNCRLDQKIKQKISHEEGSNSQIIEP